MPLESIIRLSVSEASRIFGIDQRTIRRAIKSEEIRYVVVRGRYKLNFESLLKWSQSRNTLKFKLERKGIGQYIDKWKIHNKLYSPNPGLLEEKKKNQKETNSLHLQSILKK